MQFPIDPAARRVLAELIERAAQAERELQVTLDAFAGQVGAPAGAQLDTRSWSFVVPDPVEEDEETDGDEG